MYKLYIIVLLCAKIVFVSDFSSEDDESWRLSHPAPENQLLEENYTTVNFSHLETKDISKPKKTIEKKRHKFIPLTQELFDEMQEYDRKHDIKQKDLLKMFNVSKMAYWQFRQGQHSSQKKNN